MPIQDLANNPIDPTSASFLGFRSSDAVVFPHDIYSFLMESIRQCDRDAGNTLLLRFLQQPQVEFEATQARIRGLLDIYDVERTPTEALAFVKWIVGLTGKLDFVTTGLPENDLRRLISVAVPMWKKKGTESGIVETLQAITSRKPKIVNYFDFRSLIDEIELGREDQGFDPWLINGPGFSPGIEPAAVVNLGPNLEFDLTSLLGTIDDSGQSIRMVHVPTSVVRTAVSFFTGGINKVHSSDLFGQAVPSTDVNDYRVGIDPDEYTSDIRLQDDGSGVVNRTLVEELIRLLRPHGERYFIRYVDFVDDLRENDLSFTTVQGTIAHIQASGLVELEDALQETVIASDVNNDGNWTKVVASAQLKLRDAVGWGEMRFYYLDENNFYAMRVDPATLALNLDKVTLGARSTLASVTLGQFPLDTFHFFRVATNETAGGHQIQFFVDENLYGTVVDPDHQAGKLALATATGQKLTAAFVEVFQTPLTSVYIGPNEE